MSADPRYTIFAARAVFDEQLTPFDIRVLAALGTYSDKQGWCYPRQAEIARRCSMSRQSVNTSIKRLAEHGYIQVTPQVSDKGQQVNIYRVLLDLNAPDAALEAAATTPAQVVEIGAVQQMDSRLSSTTTGLDLAPAEREEPQDVVPAVQEIDSRVSTPVDTPCQPPLTPILERARDPHKNIPKEDRKRATRLPATWAPRPEEITFGVQGGLSEAEVLAAADHMRDWAASSPKASKLDWDRTFRNWLRTTISDAKRGRRPVVTAVSPAELKRRRDLYAYDGTWDDDGWGPRPNDLKAGGRP
jgi:hypothetical protein